MLPVTVTTTHTLHPVPGSLLFGIKILHSDCAIVRNPHKTISPGTDPAVRKDGQFRPTSHSSTSKRPSILLNMDWQALLLTLRLATITTAILLLIAVPLAALLILGRSRWLAILEALTALPLVLPPTVLGFFLLVLLGPRTAFGRAIVAILGHPLAFSFSGLVVGSVIYSLPFAVQPIVAGFAAVNPALLDAAHLLGANTSRIVLTILAPLAKRSIITAAVLTFLHTVGEFGVVLMLGGDIPGATRTLSIVLYNQVEAFNYDAANRTALLLLGMSLLALLILYASGAARSVVQGERRA